MNEKWLIEQFKWLHRHPELGMQERATTAFLKDRCPSPRNPGWNTPRSTRV